MVDRLLDRSIDGVVLTTSSLNGTVARILAQARLPLVFLTRYVEGVAADSAIVDNSLGAAADRADRGSAPRRRRPTRGLRAAADRAANSVTPARGTLRTDRRRHGNESPPHARLPAVQPPSIFRLPFYAQCLATGGGKLRLVDLPDGTRTNA